MDVSVVVPTYNHVTKIFRIFDILKHTLNNLNVNYEILICDDASTDGSLRVIYDVVYGQARTRVFEHVRHTGFGETFRELIAKAQGEIIVYLDIGEQFDYQVLPLLLNKILDYHVVVSPRTVDKVKAQKKNFLKKILKMWHKATSGVPVKELDPPLAVFRKEDLDTFDLKASGKDVLLEVFQKAHQRNLSITEVS